jgi:ABC-type branched-subunit amino acid transport system ATPase component
MVDMPAHQIQAGFTQGQIEGFPASLAGICDTAVDDLSRNAFPLFPRFFEFREARALLLSGGKRLVFFPPRPGLGQVGFLVIDHLFENI